MESSENAVIIQIYTAMTTYCLVVIVGHNLKSEHSTYGISQISSISLLGKTSINELFMNTNFSLSIFNI
ncbi:hypothetical protein GCM10022397_36900 [Flavivirga jejuensis]